MSGVDADDGEKRKRQRIGDSSDGDELLQSLESSAVSRPAVGRLTAGEVQTLLSLRNPHMLGGSAKYHVRSEHLPKGPANIDEIARWPYLMVYDYFSGEAGARRASRVRNLLQHGLIVHSDCSGKLTPEATLLLFEAGMKQNGLDLPRDWLVFYRANELSPQCREIIAGCSHRPLHCFSGFLQMHPTEHAENIASMRPRADDTPQELRQTSDTMYTYDMIFLYMYIYIYVCICIWMCGIYYLIYIYMYILICMFMLCMFDINVYVFGCVVYII